MPRSPRSATLGVVIVTWEDRQQDQLRGRFPGWDVWYIRRVMLRKTTWHARLTGSPAAMVDASSPQELAQRIADYLAGGPGGQG